MDGTASDTPPRILAVADGWPWPAGSARVAAVLDGLAAAGEVDLCVLVPSPGRPPAESTAALRRAFRDHATVVAGTPARIDRLFGGGHDQVWYLTPRTLRLVGRQPAARTVVDLGGPVGPGTGRPPTRRERRQVRRDADLVLVHPDGPPPPDAAVAVAVPTDHTLSRTVAALARTGAAPTAGRLVGIDLRTAGVAA